MNGTKENNNAHSEMSNNAKSIQECQERAQPNNVEERCVVVEQENQHAPKMSTPYG